MSTNTKTKKNQNKGNGNSIIDKVITGIILLAVLGAGAFVLIKNDIKSVSDLTDFVRGQADGISSCASSDEENENIPGEEQESFLGCIQNVIAPGVELPEREDNPADNKVAQDSLSKLEEINLAEPDDSEYDRSEYKHWILLDGTCSTRNLILKEQGNNVLVDEDCVPNAGEWIDHYTGETITDSQQADIDHIVPLGYAHVHGASTWDSKQKELFANDTSNLLVVHSSENQDKGEQGPSEYMPANKEVQCEYSNKWVTITDTYNLSITVADRDKLRDVLESCV